MIVGVEAAAHVYSLLCNDLDHKKIYLTNARTMHAKNRIENK